MDEKEHILDSQNKEIITINHGAMFPSMVKVSAIFIMFFFLIISLVMPIYLMILFLIIDISVLIFVLFSSSGIDFNCSESKFRLYSKRFFVKKGEWKDIDKYHDIAILSSNKSQSFYLGFTGVGNTVKFKTYDVYLLGVNHWKKIFVASFDNLDLANNQVKKLVEMFDLQFVTYNPKRISKRRVR